MDILEKKTKFNDKLIRTLKILKFKNNTIDIKGTFSLASQKYFSDYDLFSKISKSYNKEQIYDEIKNILNKISQDEDLYFIELKIQNKNGSKKKFFELDINKNEFIKSVKDLDFIKIDLVGRFESIFTEVSIIYSFNTEIMKSEDYLKSLMDDIKELRKEKNYFKILKRYFNLAKAEGDKKLLLKISEFLNSEYGQIYQKKSNLEAINLLLDKYDDDNTLKKVLINLKDIKEEPKIEVINKNIKDMQKKLNKAGKNKINELGLKI